MTDVKLEPWVSHTSTLLPPPYLGSEDATSFRTVGQVFFETGSVVIGSVAEEAIARLAGDLRRHWHTYELIVVGHADARTSSSTPNGDLAVKRAEKAVKIFSAEFSRRAGGSLNVRVVSMADKQSLSLGHDKSSAPETLAMWRCAEFVVNAVPRKVSRACGPRRSDVLGMLGVIIRYRQSLERGGKKYWWACHTASVCRKPLPGNRISPLIDGKDTFSALFEAIRKARKYILITAWDIEFGLPLMREGKEHKQTTLVRILRNALIRGVVVRMIVWDEPATKRNAATCSIYRGFFREAEKHGLIPKGSFKIILYPTNLVNCLHQKTAVIDGVVGFCGGLDIANVEGDRWDTNEHLLNDARRIQSPKARDHWHDIHIRVEGPVVEILQHNFLQLWAEVDPPSSYDILRPHSSTVLPGVKLVQAAKLDRRFGDVKCQIIRTVVENRGLVARRMGKRELERSVIEGYARAILNARTYIYIENQYFGCEFLIQQLVYQLQKVDNLVVIIVIPETVQWPMDQEFMDVPVGVALWPLLTQPHVAGWYTMRLLRVLRAAGGERVIAVAPRNKDRSHIYVHSKVMVVDDCFATIGSANFTSRSMLYTDQEISLSWVASRGSASVSRFRVQLWSEHLDLDRNYISSMSLSKDNLIKLWATDEKKTRIIDWVANHWKKLKTGKSGQVEHETRLDASTNRKRDAGVPQSHSP